MNPSQDCPWSLYEHRSTYVRVPLLIRLRWRINEALSEQHGHARRSEKFVSPFFSFRDDLKRPPGL